jgi:hypothetical protein
LLQLRLRAARRETPAHYIDLHIDIPPFALIFDIYLATTFMTFDEVNRSENSLWFPWNMQGNARGRGFPCENRLWVMASRDPSPCLLKGRESPSVQKALQRETPAEKVQGCDPRRVRSEPCPAPFSPGLGVCKKRGGNHVMYIPLES